MTDVDVIRDARIVADGEAYHDSIVRAAASADIVLIGEASHGTHEFYATRAAITRRLIDEAGFDAVAIEGDWPDAYAVDCYVRGGGRARSADDALAGFRRFPTWMWRNTVVLPFVEWLRERNVALAPERRAGFYGLDLYSMHASADAVLRYLERNDSEEARSARERYGCFSLFGTDPQAYGYAATRRPDMSCEDAVVEQLIALQEHAREYTRDSLGAADDFFSAEQNARLVKNAEEYYRTMFRGGASSWNLRDRHMCETLYALLEHLRGRGSARPRIVVWAHNSHLGDARATAMGRWGEWNLGQLARERSGARALNVGFTTYTGTVTAASDWDETAEFKRVRPGLAGSYERLFHEVGGDFLLDLRAGDVRAVLAEPMLERAIGVIYRPDTERASHYFEATLSEQFDFVIHLDETRALEPLEPGDRWPRTTEPPETYPSGM